MDSIRITTQAGQPEEIRKPAAPEPPLQQTAEAPSAQPPKSSYMKKITLAVFLVLLMTSAGTAYYFYRQFSKIKSDPSLFTQDTNQQLVDQVGKLILLPTGEQPTIATVTDLSALKDQTFFINAKVGDKVLVYTTAKTAYLYDPTANKIINVAPINTDASATAPVGQSQTSPPSTVSGASITK